MVHLTSLITLLLHRSAEGSSALLGRDGLLLTRPIQSLSPCGETSYAAISSRASVSVSRRIEIQRIQLSVVKRKHERVRAFEGLKIYRRGGDTLVFAHHKANTSETMRSTKLACMRGSCIYDTPTNIASQLHGIRLPTCLSMH